MLVLSRKLTESIMLGHEIEVVVLGVEGDTVKLGIRAPKDVQIYRKEIYTAIQSSNREAVRAEVPLDRLKAMLKPKTGGEQDHS